MKIYIYKETNRQNILNIIDKLCENSLEDAYDHSEWVVSFTEWVVRINDL
jgi:hypothetical protein